MNRHQAPAMVLLGGVVAAPFVAAWPLFQQNGEAMAPAFDLWSARLLWATILASIAAVVATRDLWLGVAVGLGAFDVFLYSPQALARSTVGLFAFAALGLVWIRTWPASAHRIAGQTLAGIAVLEALVMLGQLGGINPLWGSWARTSSVEMTGTLGNTVFASALVAIAGPFAPWQLLPAFGLVLWFAQSKIALLAFALGCAVRFSPRAWITITAVSIAGALFLAGLGLTLSGHARLWVWQEMLARVTWLGDGLGLSAAIRAPEGSGAAFDPAGWRHVHNEPLQWIRERGLVGAVVLGAWLYRLRVTGARAARGAVAALGLVALAQAPLHIIPLGLVAVLVLGLASTPLSSPSDPTGA